MSKAFRNQRITIYQLALFAIALAILLFAHPSTFAGTHLSSGNARQELVFIESNVEDHSTLVRDFGPGVHPYVLDAQQDGLVEMARVLSQYDKVDAIHLVSHGASGALHLGALTLTESNLGLYVKELAAVRRALKPGGDLLLYGCEVAAGQKGQNFVSALSRETQVAVAASVNKTGAKSLGGDWVLEQRSEAIQTASLASPGYSHLLANGIITFTSNAGGLGTSGIAADGQGGSTDLPGIVIQISNISDTAGTQTGTMSWQDNVFLNSNDSSFNGVTYDQNAGSKGMRIKSSDGSKFKLTQFKHYNWGETSTTTMTVKGYRNSVEVGSATFEAYMASYLPFDVVLDSSFNNVDDVRFYITAGGYLGTQAATNLSINNIVIADAVPAAPTATTGAATSITATGATLNGTVNDNGASTTVTFEYGLTNAYGSSAAATTGGTVGAGAGATAASVAISSLSCNTTYHFRVNGVSSAGTTNGSDATFTTSKCPQTITFNNPGTQSFGTTPTLPATATSGLAPTFTTTTAGVCTISTGGVLTTVTTGSCTINANQAGDATYAAASQVQQSFTIAAVAPGTPTIGTATAGDAQASVTFTAPASNGGAAITTYTATANSGGAFGTCAGPAACTITVLGLTNGTAYTFTVTATNGAGTSTASSASNSVTPKGAQAITFNNPGAQNFGTSPTVTATATSTLAPTFTTATAGVCTITPGGTLTFVTAGSCTISANQAGNGSFNAAPQVQQTFTVNAVAPGAPTIGTATAGDTQATVTFTAPASNGGAAIIASGYTVTANPGGATATSSSSPVTVTGLTNGLAYTFTVTATNSAGEGNPSAASNSVTPASPQTITFNNPGTQNFGTTPTLTASSSAGGGYVVTFTSSTTGVCTVTSGGVLTFVTAGTCTINANQAGDTSFLAAPQVSQTFSVSPVVPGAPTNPVATAGDTQASIAFVAPVNIGGSAITNYTVTVNPADVGPVNGASSPIVVTSLTNGVAYTFTVTATNAAGTGSASSASNSITPAATQTITFAAPGPQNFGTTPTLSATADSGLTPTFTSSTAAVCTITTVGALTFVTTGNCTINADQAGNGSYLPAPQVSRTFAVNAVVPGSPTIGTATGGNAEATVAFTAPASAGGAAITGYTVTVNPGGATATGAASPITVTGLTNGTSYTFTVAATNSVGPGAPSAASNAVIPRLLTVTGMPPGMGGAATATLSGGGPTCTLDPTSGFASLSNPAPAGKTMPYGEYAFQATSCTGTVTMAITYPQPLPTGTQFWKFGPATPAVGGVAAASTWFQLGSASLSGDRLTVTYTITDDGAGDSDATPGRISDPFALAAGPLGGDAVGIPVDAPWALGLLSAVLGFLGWRRQRALLRG